MLGRLPVTVELGLLAILIGLVIALPVGIYSAVRQYTAADYVGRSVAIMGLATPNFWLGTMVMIYPAIWWAWSPPMELIPLAQDPLGNLGMFLIPSLILGTYLAASTMRMTRTMMLEVLRQDILVLVSIFADGLAPYRFEEIHLRDRLQAPSAQYLLGTDHVGRDLLSRLIPRGAAVTDGGAGRHRPQRRGGGADRRHHRLHRRPAGLGDAALRRCLDGIPGAAVAAHHHEWPQLTSG